MFQSLYLVRLDSLPNERKMNSEEPTSDTTSSTCKTPGLLATAVIALTPAAPGTPPPPYTRFEIVNASCPSPSPSVAMEKHSFPQRTMGCGRLSLTLKSGLSCHLVASSSKCLKSPALTRQSFSTLVDFHKAFLGFVLFLFLTSLCFVH